MPNGCCARKLCVLQLPGALGLCLAPLAALPPGAPRAWSGPRCRGGSLEGRPRRPRRSGRGTAAVNWSWPVPQPLRQARNRDGLRICGCSGAASMPVLPCTAGQALRALTVPIVQRAPSAVVAIALRRGEACLLGTWA